MKRGAIGILPEQGGSLRNLDKSGQGERFVRFYLERYGREFDEAFYFSYENELNRSRGNIHFIGNSLRWHRWIYAFLLPFVHRKAFQRCDLIRLMQATGEVPAILAKVFYRKPFVPTYGYCYSENARLEGHWVRSAFLSLRERIILAFADRVIVTTPVLFHRLAKRIPEERLLLIPNSVDTTLFSPAQRRPLAKRRLLFVGHLSPIKNVSLLIHAVSRLKDVHLVLIGEGPLKASLEEQAARQGVSVAFKGIVAHEALPDEMRRSDFFVLPSRREGNPKVLLEAMSCALPCIGTDVEGIRELIQDGKTGLLCQLDAADLAEKLDRLIQDEAFAETLGKNARDYVVEHHDSEKILSQEIQCLKALTNGEDVPHT